MHRNIRRGLQHWRFVQKIAKVQNRVVLVGSTKMNTARETCINELRVQTPDTRARGARERYIKKLQRSLNSPIHEFQLKNFPFLYVTSPTNCNLMEIPPLQFYRLILAIVTDCVSKIEDGRKMLTSFP